MAEYLNIIENEIDKLKTKLEKSTEDKERLRIINIVQSLINDYDSYVNDQGRVFESVKVKENPIDEILKLFREMKDDFQRKERK